MNDPICSFRVKGSWSRTWQIYPDTDGTRKVITVASARPNQIIENHIPKIPKKPRKPLATRSHLTSRAPRGKSGIFVHHIYVQLITEVASIRMNRIWNGCIPSPSSAKSRAARFISAENSCAVATRTTPRFLAQKRSHDREMYAFQPR